MKESTVNVWLRRSCAGSDRSDLPQRTSLNSRILGSLEHAVRQRPGASPSGRGYLLGMTARLCTACRGAILDLERSPPRFDVIEAAYARQDTFQLARRSSRQTTGREKASIG